MLCFFLIGLGGLDPCGQFMKNRCLMEFLNYSLWFFIIAQTIAKIPKTDMHFFITAVL